MGGSPGQFRANESMIGWKGDEGGEAQIHEVATVKRAEWLEGKLRVLCQDEDGTDSVLSVEGFANTDFDTLHRHFSEHCGVYIKKHRPAASLSEANFDSAMQSLEKSADQVDAQTSGSVMKKSKEQDLLKKVEGVRDGLEEAVKGDKQALSRVFAHNGCERIGRLRLVLDTVQLEVYHKDQRWRHLRNIARTIEGVLKEIGTFQLWKPSEESGEDAAMARRQMVWELRKKQGGGGEGMMEDDDEWEQAQIEEAPPKPKGPSAVEIMRAKMEAAAFNPLAGPALMPIPGMLAGPLGSGNPLANGGYAADVPEPPMPEPAPAEEPEWDEEEEEEEEEHEHADIMGEEEPSPASHMSAADLAKYEDAEVADPLATAAAPPGQENAMGLGMSEQHRRMQYTRTDSVLEGWVWKRSRFLKKWRRRWLVLTKNGLESMKQRDAPKPTETIEAGSVHRVYSADGEVQMARCFCVVGNKRSFFMVCDNEAQKAEWIRQVETVLGSRRSG